jgi:hypothetical protein
MDLNALWESLVFGSKAKRRAQALSIVARELRDFFKNCPICGRHFKRHKFARFALTPLTTENEQRVEEFLCALRQHRWRDVIRFQQFKPYQDVIVAHAVRCSNEKLCWLAVEEPYEYFAPFVREWGVLDLSSSRELEGVIKASAWARLDR